MLMLDDVDSIYNIRQRLIKVNHRDIVTLRLLGHVTIVQSMATSMK